MKLKLLSLHFVTCMLLLSTSFAENEWSQNGVDELPATEKENRIIKWCSPDGSRTRFASANLEIKGYEPCGKLEAVSSCDAVGNRLISKSSDRPMDHKDCSTAPRIVVISHDKPKNESGDIEPMTSEEKRSLRRDMKAAEKKQEQDPEIQLQKAMNNLLTTLLGVDQEEIDRLITGGTLGLKKNKSRYRQSRKNRRRGSRQSKNYKKSDLKALIKQFNSMSQHLDPAQKEQFEKLLNLP